MSLPTAQEHYKYGGHESACKAYVLAATVHAQQERLCKAAVESDRCLICLEPPREPMRLPCGHSFCTGCVGELRSKGVSETCPLCRAPLPPGPEKLFELAHLAWWKLRCAVGSKCEWPPLSASQQEEMDGAIVMFQEAMDQVGERASARFDGAMRSSRVTILPNRNPPPSRATSSQLRPSATSTALAKAWRSTTRGRRRRTRSLPRRVTL